MGNLKINGRELALPKLVYDKLVELKLNNASNFWQLGSGNRSIWIATHKVLEKLAGALGIVIDKPKIIESNPEKCYCVVLVSGKMKKSDGEEVEQWSFGEACVGVNLTRRKKKSGGFVDAYPYAMAEKRGIDRVILKLLGIHGDVYSSEEAEEFKSAKNTAQNNPINANANVGDGFQK